MHSYTFPPEFVKRYSSYLASNEFRDIPEFSKSSYWKYHSDVMNVQIDGNRITTSGDSGYYTPGQKKSLYKAKKFLHYLVKEPGKIKSVLKANLGLAQSGIKMLGWEEAFDQVMSHGPAAGVVLTPECINFKKLARKSGGVGSISEMREKFYAKDKYRVNAHNIIAYYFWNIINGYIDMSKIKTIMEIGAGNGNLAAVMFHHLKDARFIIVDIPETLCVSIAYIADVFPAAKVCFPHEYAARKNEPFDFVFLTPKQIGLIQDNSIDLAVNSVSFQEMTHQQIDEYFKLIHRSVRNGGYFFTANRTEKVPVPPIDQDKEVNVPMNRFSEYPWHPGNQTLINEISRLHSMAQIEPISMRLDRIIK